MAETAELRHKASCSNRDYDFFYEGLEDQHLLIQQCSDCKELRHPPEPMCPHCHSVRSAPAQMAGTGTIYSFAVHYHPPLPGFEMPHPIGIVELDEGVRVVAGLDGMALDEIAIGVPVKAEFFRRGEMATLRFRRA